MTDPPPPRRSWVLALAIGAALGLAVAGVMTYLDWRLNPGGVFQGPGGTRWSAVTETATSWFVPVALSAAALSFSVLCWLRRRGC